jgi:hypothetical protein
MAEIKNFGLAGAGSDLQLGKAGPRLIVNGSAVEAHGSDGTSFVTLRSANAVAQNDVVVLAQLDAQLALLSNTISNSVALLSNSITNSTITNGFGLVLGNSISYGDPAWSTGAVSLNDSSTVSYAVDALNGVLAKLVPTAPPNFPNSQTVGITSVGSSPVLASGVTDNAGSGITAGTAVTRITGNLSSNNTIALVGPGNSGTLSLYINNSVIGSHTLTGTSDNGNYSGLVIAGQASYPASTPGFWQSVNVSVSAATVSTTGVNSVHITDSAASNTSTVYFVKDSLTSNPVVTGQFVALGSNGTLAYSSSVPHFGTGGTLTVGGSISNLAGQTYYNGNPLTVTGSNSIFGSQAYSYGTTGISTPIPQNTTAAHAISNVTVNVNGTNIATSGLVTLTASNVNGTGSASPSTIILVKNGTTTNVDELNVPVSSLGSSPNNNNALRVGMANGDTPSNSTSSWVQSAAINTWDATVVAGVLKNDTTNYTTGYLPAGPNLSGQAAAQYVTFAFERSALSQFVINVTGTYAGCWISLPGVSDNSSVSPHALGGAWWTMFASYNGAGVPGFSGDTTAGCAYGTVMSGTSGSYTVTFGTASSTSATGNTILVRFRLNSGQSITSLSFS